MTDPVADAARAATAILAPDHSPALPPGTERITEIVATEITRHASPPQ